MMKHRSGSALLMIPLLLLVNTGSGWSQEAALNQPDYEERFTSTLDPNRWFAPQIQPLPNAASGHGVRLAPGGTIVLMQLPNPRTLHFDLHTVDGSGNSTVAVERSCNAGSTWTRITEVRTAGNPTPAAVSLDTVGNCQARWVLPPGSAPVWVANVTFYALTPDQVQQVVRLNEIQAQANTIFKTQTDNVAADALKAAGRQAIEQMEHLSEVASDAYLFAALNQFGSAIGRRAELVNPLQYGSFTSLLDSVKPVVSPVMRTHIEAEKSVLGNVVNGIINVASGNWVGALTQVTNLVPQLHSFRTGIQSLLAIVGSDKDQFKKFSAAAKQNPEQVAVSLYVRSNQLLEGLTAEADTLTKSLEGAVALAQRNFELAGRTERHLTNLLEFAGMGERVRDYRIAVRERNRGGTQPTDTALINGVRRRYSEKVDSITRITPLPITNVNNIRQALSTDLTTLPAIDRERRALLADQTTFFATQINYLCNVRPRSENTGIVAEWNGKVVTAIQEMRQAQESFHRSVSRDEAPRPQTCRNHPPLADAAQPTQRR